MKGGRTQREGGGGEALWTAPTKEMKSPLEKIKLCLIDGHEGRKDTMGGRTHREEGHKGRKDTKGGRTQREEGHEEREQDTKGGRTRGKREGRTQRERGGGEALWTAPTKAMTSLRSKQRRTSSASLMDMKGGRT